MNPANLNPGTLVDDKQKRLMSIIHTQCPVGAQHENSVESRIRLVKQFALNMLNKVKGERYKPLSITQTDFIFSSALYERKHALAKMDRMKVHSFKRPYEIRQLGLHRQNKNDNMFQMLRLA